MAILQPTKEQIDAALEAERQKRADRESLTGRHELETALGEYRDDRSQYREHGFSSRTLAAAMELVLELQAKVSELESRVASLEYGSGPENDY